MGVREPVEERIDTATGEERPRILELSREDLDYETTELFRQGRASAARSRERRAAPASVRPAGPRRWWPAALVAAAACVGIGSAALAEPLDDGAPAAGARSVARPLVERHNAAPKPLPERRAVAEAREFARSRAGLVSFAVVNSRGGASGLDADRRYVSASVVKSMLLAAELRRLGREDAPLDGATEATLRAMITYSDNDAADTIYYRVGDAGLYEVAREAGMERFDVYGYWANAQLTAADMARMFAGLERAMAGPHREFGLGLLGSVIPQQSWGIPAAVGDRWAVRFKGGWRSTDRGQLVHQVAELRDGDRLLSLAVLTDGQPTQAYGIETVRGIAERLVAKPAAPTRPSSRRAWRARRGS